MTWDGGRQQHGTKNMVLVGLLFLEKERTVSKFDLRQSREGFCQRGRGRSRFQMPEAVFYLKWHLFYFYQLFWFTVLLYCIFNVFWWSMKRKKKRKKERSRFKSSIYRLLLHYCPIPGSFCLSWTERNSQKLKLTALFLDHFVYLTWTERNSQKLKLTALFLDHFVYLTWTERNSQKLKLTALYSWIILFIWLEQREIHRS